jgi:enoyl-CoA hydratase
LAREAGRIGVTELLVGVPFPALAFEILRFAVPPRYLSEFTLGAATYVTDAALRQGWVDEVVEPDALMGHALATAQSLAALSPLAFAQTKKQLRQPVAKRYAQSGAAVDKTVLEIWTASATLAHIRDYVVKTLKKS